MLSKCAAKYALAISDPFHPSARNACLPIYPGTPSQKLTGFTRFTAAIGTAGFGFATFHPSLANDSATACFTTTAYTGTTVFLATGTNLFSTGINTALMTNLPYSGAQLTGNQTANSNLVAGRLVSYGFRVSYTGTTMNESGAYYCYCSNNHENVAGLAATIPAIGALTDGDVRNINRVPCSGSLTASTPGETDYNFGNDFIEINANLIYPYCGGSTNLTPGTTNATVVSGATNIGAPPAVVMFTGVPGSTFLIEVIAHVEYTGTLTAATATPSECDTAGFEKVQQANCRLPQLKQAAPEGTTAFQLMGTALRQVYEEVKPHAVNALFGAAKMGLMALL
jgi:hypothetical protein